MMFEEIKHFLQKLFTPSTEELQPELDEGPETAPLTDVQIEAITGKKTRLEPVQFTACSAISIGREREINQDALFTFSTVLACETSNVTLGVFILADGMGGHEQGEVASNTAVRAMADHLLRNYYFPFFALEPRTPEESVQEVMEQGITIADRVVSREAPEGGTTMTAVLILGRRMTIAHVGDSRAYAISNSQIRLLTRDHSMAKRLEELNQITPEEAETHPKRHDLYRAVGLEVPAEPDIFTALVQDYRYLLICSDGLWDVVPESEIYRLVSSTPKLSKACQDLIDAANAAGGPDNISVVLVRMPD
jgi:serine/threonine protein phosphatase PrpC